MRFSSILPLLAISGAAAFQTPSRLSLAVTNLNKRDVASSVSALRSTTMDETSLEVVNGVNGIKRKKTKKVSLMLLFERHISMKIPYI